MNYFRECGMLSAENIAAVKVAVQICCNNIELKKQMFHISGSNYDINKKRYPKDCKEKWNDIIERKTIKILEGYGLPKHLQEKVTNLVLLVGMRMLIWAVYHEGAIELSCKSSYNFINSSFFTSRGDIDSKKAAEELMKDESLSIKQKYKLACLYCFEENIPTLYRQMTKEDTEEFYAERPLRVNLPKLVFFWSYYLRGEIDELKGEKVLGEYRLEKAIESGSKAGVKYCLQSENLSKKEGVMVDAALKTVRSRQGQRLQQRLNARYNCICFRNEISEYTWDLWTPLFYYEDILCFLLSEMEESQQIQFLKKDVEDYKSGESEFFLPEYYTVIGHRSSRVLIYFLNWPYQDYFMKTAGLMWDFLPENDFAVLLLRVCDKIESKAMYGDEISYDYRRLLSEFWYKSPERFKRHVFRNQKVAYVNNIAIKACVELLVKLLTLKNFTYEDKKNIELILASATDKEKENIISSEEWRNICSRWMKEEKWEVLDRFVLRSSHLRLFKKQGAELKRELSFSVEAQCVCLDFLTKRKWIAAESFIMWSSLPENEVNQLKKEMIYSDYGMDLCVKLILYLNKEEVCSKFMRWCLPPEEDVEAFKKEVIFSYEGIRKCRKLISQSQFQLASEFISLGLSSEEEIRELKKRKTWGFGRHMWETLISNFYKIGRTKCNGDKWEKIEKLFKKLGFFTEEQIKEFKKARIT